MKILVCLKEVIDSTLSLDIGLDNRVVLQEGLPLRLNPADAAALSAALALTLPETGERPEITVLSIGPERVERYLRQGLSLGAAKAVRITDSGGELSPDRKARLLSAAVKLLGADLVLAGAASMDTADAQVGPLTAARLGFPGICDVVAFEPAAEPDRLLLVKDIGMGEREKLWCSLPAVVTVKGAGTLPYASLDSLVESEATDITLLTTSDLGITPVEAEEEPVRVNRLVFPRPRPRKAAPLDCSLPAFYRILQLLQGGISKRRGRMLEGGIDEQVEQLFKLLLEAEVIKSPGAE